MAEQTSEEAKKEWLYNAVLDIKKNANTESELNELIRRLKELVPYKDSEALLQEAEDMLKLEQDYLAALDAEAHFQANYEPNDYDEDDIKELLGFFDVLGQYKDAPSHAAKAQNLLDSIHAARAKKNVIKIVGVAAVLVVSVVLFLYEILTSRDEFSELIARAETGDILAQYQLGNMYYNGEGVSVNYKEAFRWYRMAAGEGHAEAQYYVGHLYHNGQGVEKDIPKAVAWYRRAAEQDHPQAQYKMGGAYYNGWGVVRNYKEALKWYRKSARRGNAEAQTAVGNIYYNGMGVERNYPEAIVWYKQAAEQGYSWAQYYLGNMYRNGLGIPKDLAKARDLYQKAAEQGHLGAMRAFEHIKDL